MRRYFYNKFKHVSYLLLLLLALIASGCSSMKPQDFSSKSPQLIPEQYFSGDLEGVGVFYDRFGDIQTSFVVTLRGNWDANSKLLILKEDLIYENGEKLFREYKINKVNDNLYTVDTEDFEGQGKIEVYGNTMKWNYELNQQIKESKVLLYFNDWMHLQPNGVILNRAFVSKFGISVGEVFMSIKRTTEV